jgi:hypothetical protein
MIEISGIIKDAIISWKTIGLLVAVVSGIVGICKDAKRKSGKLTFTKSAKWLLHLLCIGFLLSLTADVNEQIQSALKSQQQKLDTAFSQHEARMDARRAAFKSKEEVEELQLTHKNDIERIQRENQQETRKQLDAQSVRMAEMFFQGRNLDAQRAGFLEQARQAGLQVKMPERTNNSSTSNLNTQIQTAVKSLPDELRAATEVKNKEEAEKVATEAKAKELDKGIRARFLDGLTLIQSVIAQAQQGGLVTVTNIDPLPSLPDRIVFSRHETNFTSNRYTSPYMLPRFFGTNHQQRIAFGHGETWVVSFLPGFLESSSVTNENFFPKIRIGRPGPNARVLADPPIAILNFDPATVELRISNSNTPHETDEKLKCEDRVTGALVEILRRSVLAHAKAEAEKR